MSRGPRPRRALPEAIRLAHLRGTIQPAGKGPEALYHFTILANGMIAFVRVRFAARILASPAEIAATFKEEILRLRAVTQDAAISRELWLRSKHGTWRFFRVTAEGLVELDRDGQVSSGGTVAPGPM